MEFGIFRRLLTTLFILGIFPVFWITPVHAAGTGSNWTYIINPRINGFVSNFFSPGVSVAGALNTTRTMVLINLSGKKLRLIHENESQGGGPLKNGQYYSYLKFKELNRPFYLLGDTGTSLMDDTGLLYAPTQTGDFPNPGIGLTGVKVGSKWGYASTQTGKIVIPAIWSYVTEFWDHTAAVKFGDKWGYIKCTGKSNE